ncbi:MAG: hypothetical protein U5N86_03220 [Planctomycetota bacterium]|nr:hypothetical protein [Planctomycetota bacterium]
MKLNMWRPLFVILAVLFCASVLPKVQAAEQTNPDLTGYKWVDNKAPQPYPDTPQGNALTWIEVSQTGTDLLAAPGFNDLNDGSIGVTTPFLPTFYGSLFGMGSAPLYVSINGFISFGTPVSGVTSAFNTSLPNTAQPNNLLAPFWDDLDASANGHIYYDVVGIAPNRILVVQWSNMSFNQQTANLNFQVQIFETVTATPYAFVYGNMTSPDAARATGSSATIGLEDSTGTKGTLYSYNIPNNIISNETTIGFYPPLNLLGTPTFTKGAGFADSMRILWGSASTPSIVGMHFMVAAPIEEDIELTGLELQADLPDNPDALDLDESEYISGINIFEDIDRNAQISSSERNNNLILAWAPSPQQPFANNGTLSLPLSGQNVIATASRMYIIEIVFNTNAATLPLENEGFKLRLHRISYRGITSNASRLETLDYETGSIYVEDGFNPYGSLSVMSYSYGPGQLLALPGGQAVGLSFKVTIGTVEDIRWETLRVRGMSTGNIINDITSIDMYIDQNANGRLDAGKPQAGTNFSFTNGDLVTINAPLGQDFARGTIGYYLAVFNFRNKTSATDLSLLNTTHQIAFEMDLTYMNLSYYTSPRLLGGTIVGTFQPRVQELPRPAVLCEDTIGRRLLIGNQMAMDKDITGRSIEGGGGCFVATAAFGSYNASSVVDLCSVRDSVLNSASSGSSLVSL